MSEPEPEIVDGLVKGAERLIRTSERPLSRVVVRSGEASVEMEWPSVPQAAVVVEPVLAVPDESRAFVRAPMVGTFYRAPEPGADPFVRSGDLVELGAQIGILEAMKIMNPIQADVEGIVSEVLVPDGTQVEYDQPLVAIEPVGS
ncbi:acetyl-CoA carboxylase biotin carboxyl carrier protein [Nonomuraea sp. NPDC050556]|uniref:acetyl-CoA carboxylase biotin carboxyl carrier protein n=1 Tax=Nonomuraea sp. NPDC050556 TaxID=3364369 RepID=UPI0037ABE6D3